MMDRQAEIRRVVARERQAKYAARFIAKLSLLFGEPIREDAIVAADDLPAMQSLYLRACEEARQSENFMRRFNAGNRSEFFAAIDAMLPKVCKRECILLTKMEDTSFAIRLDAGLVLSHAASVLQFDGDSVCLFCFSGDEGVCIDWNRDDSDWTYELLAWGSFHSL